jgi:uncharacterized protein (TIGR00369 family)
MRSPDPYQKHYRPPHIADLVPRNPNYEAFIKEKLSGQYFMRHIGFDLTTIEPGYIEGRAPISTFLTQQDGYVHGGVTATVADIVCGFAAFSLVRQEEHVVTGDLSLAFLAPGKGQKVFAKGYVLKPGKRLNFCEGEVYTEDPEHGDTLIARVHTTMTKFTPGQTQA